MRAFVRDHALAAFFVLTYALTWAYWIPLAAGGWRVAPGSTVTHFPGLMGPAIAAFVVSACCGERTFRDLLARLVLVSRPAGRFWVYTLSPAAFLALAIVAARISGTSLPPLADFARFSGVPDIGLVPVFAIVLVANGYGEETGWRGFALPRLQHRFGPLRGIIVLTIAWGMWHAPAFVFIEEYRVMTVPMILGGFAFGLFAGSVVFARVSKVTGGSVLSVAVWHALYNMTSATAASRGLVAAVTTTCVVAWAVGLVVLEARRGQAASLLLAPIHTAPDAEEAAAS